MTEQFEGTYIYIYIYNLDSEEVDFNIQIDSNHIKRKVSILILLKRPNKRKLNKMKRFRHGQHVLVNKQKEIKQKIIT